MQQQEVGAGGRSRRWVFDGFGGFAAFRAESLWLSVCALKLPAATPREAKPPFVGVGWSESRRHSAPRAAKPPLTDRTPRATCRHLLLPTAAAFCLLSLHSPIIFTNTLFRRPPSNSP